jgi:predicted ATP-grasp superfamily ATP-dependent carboligase
MKWTEEPKSSSTRRAGGAVSRAELRAAVLPDAILSDAILPDAILLGGDANALSAARSLGRLGVKVHVINESDSPLRSSRYCNWISMPHDCTPQDSWTRFLLGSDSEFLRGAVLLAFSDSALQLLADNRAALSHKFKLDNSDPAAQMALLNKLSTYESALAAGVPTPKFWIAQSRSQVISLRDSLVFPLIVKPLLAHRAKKQFGQKHAQVTNFAELLRALDAENAAGVEVLMMEIIPGPDDRLCSYYTYLDENGTPLFNFTKRIIRRYPVGMGPACYHITDWVPEIVEQSQRLFRHVGLRGLANVEFKKDERDGLYKLIECNARFTAANCLVAASGFDLSAFVYRRIVGLPQEPLKNFKRGLRLWDPAVDCLSFIQQWRQGDLGLAKWIGTLLHRQTFAYFAWSDPMPSISRGRKLIRMMLHKWRQSGAERSPVATAPPGETAADSYAADACAMSVAGKGPP